jgi:hypothetical protein
MTAKHYRAASSAPGHSSRFHHVPLSFGSASKVEHRTGVPSSFHATPAQSCFEKDVTSRHLKYFCFLEIFRYVNLSTSTAGAIVTREGRDWQGQAWLSAAK